MQAKGTLYVISAPSGGGKTSLIQALLAKVPNMVFSVSHTTRAPRQGEQEGLDYYFVDEKTFKRYQDKGIFVESAKVFNHYYGTSKESISQALTKGQDVILEIDWQGARLIKAQMDCVCVFILPPSKEVLLTRLKARQQDTLTVIENRMKAARDEMSHYREYDYLIINHHFEEALTDLITIVRAKRLQTANQMVRQQLLLQNLID